MNQWYVVHTRPQGEMTALENLQRQGFTAYLPRYKKRRKHARRSELVSAPLFPRYLFISMDAAVTRWRAIRSTFGVKELICQGETPLSLQPGIVEEIREREDAEGLVHMNPADRLARGDKVLIESGPLCDRVGIFDSINDDQRINVLLDLLGRRIKVQVSPDSICALA